MPDYRSIEWKDGVLRLLDQRQLPHTVVYLDYHECSEVAQAIKDMVIRGAPAIGVAAAYGLALVPYQRPASNVQQTLQKLEAAAAALRAARPTAVNLFYAVERILARVDSAQPGRLEELRRVVLAEVEAIAAEDAWINQNISLNALPLVPQKAVFIHHCNTGALATSAYGTALGIIRAAHEHGRQIFVYVDETRPRLQGARLTAWELAQLGIPHAVIVDGASGYIMKTRQVDLVTVGCDRVAANGDTANKIGTYNLALAAHVHAVPFYVAAPTTTLDLSLDTGEQITIEERDGAEVGMVGRESILPEGTQVVNPAFDVTPAEFITAIITEEGIANPPYRESLPRLVARAQKRRLTGGSPPAAGP